MLTWVLEQRKLMLQLEGKWRGSVSVAFTESGSTVFTGQSLSPGHVKHLYKTFDTLDEAKAWVEKKQKAWR